ncbi:response regulator [Bacteroides xylanisolvens]|uniref:response regulator n=1 Tax=Bacteroides xylanisolvens TaxID=371601 RepID=UPI0039B36C63
METVIDFIGKHYQWIFSGIGVALAVGIYNHFFNKGKSLESSIIQEGDNVNNINIEINSSESKISKDHALINSSSKDPKDIIYILFIDDEKFNMVSILKKAGWKNTNSVKDVCNLGDENVKRSDIIFVDINGVGKNLFENQGIGLASALKDKYPNKKIVIYSAETTGDRFDKSLRKVDECLAKNAEPYEFLSLVENFAEEICNEQKNNY